jgi:hypothetical protein
LLNPETQTTSSSKSIGSATNAIRYWDVRINKKVGRESSDGVFNNYLPCSNVYVVAFDKFLSLSECHRQARNAKTKLKNSVSDAKECGTMYEMEFVISRVHKRHPELFDNPAPASEREEYITEELKTRENRRTTARSYRKLGRQIRGNVKSNSIKKLFITSLDVPGDDELWRCVEGKYGLEEHLIQRNMEQFSHEVQTPFGYTDLDKELGHTCDSPLVDIIYDGILEQDALSDLVIQEIVDQLKKHPLLVNIIKPVVTPEDFKSDFICVPVKTSPSLSGRGVHHYTTWMIVNAKFTL